MNKTLTSLVAFLMLATSAATLVQADQQNHEPTEREIQGINAEREQRIGEFFADFNAPSVLDAAEAADLPVALATGKELAPDAKVQLAKFMRDAEGAGLDAPMTEQFADAATRGHVAENGLEIARDLVADDDGFDALVERGAFATPGDSFGITTGYTADRTQAWTLNVMAVRLSTAGLGSTGAAPEPPATIYCDSSSSIFTGSGLMYHSDWNAANDVHV